MTKETITRIKLSASEGMVLTNGKIYGRELFLSTSADESNFYEISEGEYAQILDAERGVTDECLTLF